MNQSVRIDIHPSSTSDVVFFGIEGCPKADSMLQNIIDLGTVAIVPDADWSD